MAIHDRLRYFNKRVTNRLFAPIAGKRHSPYALLFHRGRKSGKVYSIPVITAKKGNNFFFTLPYGTKVDWIKNITTVGTAEIRWQGADYSLSNLQPVDKDEGLKTFGTFVARVLRLYKVCDFARMDGIEKKSP